MHVPTRFQQHDIEQLKQVIIEYPFATLITHSEHGIEANHIPFILDDKNNILSLHGHIATVNPLWKNVAQSSDVLVVFNGPNCYISPNHYPTKKEHGKAVPTWNYVVVHVKGKITFIHDDAWNMNMLEKLTLRHEQKQQEQKQHEANHTNKQEKPWSISDAPEAYIQKMMPAITGIQITISSITGQWKVSQNQPKNNQQGVIAGLSTLHSNKSDEQKIAELIQQLPPS